MRYLNRTIILLVVFSLAAGISATAQTSPEGKIQTFTISGNAGVGGVKMMGLPGEPVTDDRGSYSVIVDYGWSGTVTPMKEGYLFEPPCLIYSKLTDHANDKYAPMRITITISGKVGIPGVEMQGLPGDLVTDGRGYYSVTVDYGWSGTVTPVKEGYTFEPRDIFYTKLSSDQVNHDYRAKIITFTISGTVGLSGVEMRGLPGNTVSDETGSYSSTVLYGWAGTVSPRKEGYKFRPASKVYNKVIANLNNQSYTAEQQMFTISDVVMVGGSPIPGVLASASPGGQSSHTDVRGRFNVTVPYGWSGKLTLAKKGLQFNPPSQSFTNVTTNIRDGQPAQPGQWRFEENAWQYGQAGVDGRSSRRTGRSAGYWPAISPMADRKVLVVPAAEVTAEDLAAITEDMQIMSHILDERFKETRRVQGVFTDFGDFFGRDSRTTEATYLQGYGVLFSMEVNFAFSPPPEPQGQETEQTTENVDSTWQRARRQMFSPGDSRGSRGSGSAEEYNSQMVEELKRDLITTLKHAANIRGVQPDEWVILTVIGGGRQSGGVFGGRGFMMGGMGAMYGGSTYEGASSGGRGGSSGGYGIGGGSGGGGMMGGGMGGMGGGMMGGMGGGMGGFGGMSASSATVLTIRAKKSDVDSFAKGQQDFEQFRQKVQIFTY